ncbi:hypothetical protein BMW23_0335 [Bodo saltans virus]|uniref:Uncharacterized protein n=1 Tax=Bodo saltans virus TaxID=2024608 RepID=A0A2H4UTY6_9VIRU|nr:hypothetical protein QJ851_gp0329 [Bodo saltans virus]ATZ80392.1 hypothetical protein BMW23_0335 [Bodo saltans virus]
MFKTNLPYYNEILPTSATVQRSLNSNDNYKFEQTGYWQVVDNGTYYYPAWKHYGKHVNVFCDRCNRSCLSASIGFKNYDLCLRCVDELTSKKIEDTKCGGKFINDNSITYQNNNFVDINSF